MRDILNKIDNQLIKKAIEETTAKIIIERISYDINVIDYLIENQIDDLSLTVIADEINILFRGYDNLIKFESLTDAQKLKLKDLKFNGNSSARYYFKKAVVFIQTQESNVFTDEARKAFEPFEVMLEVAARLKIDGIY